MPYWRRIVAMFCAFVVPLPSLAAQRSRSGAIQNSSAPSPAAFFPVAVWYSGGKARAPMLERLDSTSAQRWGKDLDQIKGVGFNTVKTWVDWATAEPKPGLFHF